MAEAVELQGVSIPISVSLLDLTSGIANAIPKLNSIIGSVAGLTAELSALESVASTIKTVFGEISKLKLDGLKIPAIKVPEVEIPDATITTVSEVEIPKAQQTQQMEFPFDPEFNDSLAEAIDQNSAINDSVKERLASLQLERKYIGLSSQEIEIQEAIRQGMDAEHLDVLREAIALEAEISAENATRSANEGIKQRVDAMMQEYQYAGMTTREIQMQEAIQSGADKQHLDMLDAALAKEEAITNKRTIQAQLIAVGAAATAAAGSWLWAYSDMEKALNTFQAKVDDSTKSQRAALMQYAQDVGAAYGKSSTEIIAASVVIADYAYGVEGAANIIGRSKTIIAATMDYVVATGKDTASAIDQLSRIINTLGLASTNTKDVADNMVEIGDKISMMAQMAAGDVDQFADALSKKSLIAMRSYGASLDELGAALGVLSSTGFAQGSEAGNKMATTFTQLQKNMLKNRSTWESLLTVVDPVTKQLKEFSIIDQATGGFAKLDDIVGALSVRWKGLSEVEMASQAVMLGLNRATYETIQTLVLNNAMLQDYTDTMGNSAGTAARISGIMQQGFAPAMDRLRKSIYNVGEALGQYLAVPVAIAANALKGMVSLFNMLPGPIKAVIAIATGLTGVVIAGTVAVYGAIQGVRSLMGVYAKAGVFIFGNTSAVAANTAAVAANTAANAANAASRQQMLPGFSAASTSATTASVSGAFGSMKKMAGTVGSALMLAFKPSAILGFLKTALKLTVTFGKFAAIGTGVGAVILGIVQAVSSLWSYISKANDSIAKANEGVSFFGSMWKSVTEAAKGIWNVIVDVGTAIYDALIAPFNEFADAIFGGVQGGKVLETIMYAISNIVWGISKAIEFVVWLVGVALVKVFEVIGGLLRVIMFPFVMAIKAAIAYFAIIRGVLGEIYNVFTGNWDALGENLTASFNYALDYMWESWNSLMEKMNPMNWFKSKPKVEVGMSTEEIEKKAAELKITLDTDGLDAAQQQITDGFESYHLEIATVGIDSSAVSDAYSKSFEVLASVQGVQKQIEAQKEMADKAREEAEKAGTQTVVDEHKIRLKALDNERIKYENIAAAAVAARSQSIEQAKLQNLMELRVTDAIDGQMESIKQAYVERLRLESIARGDESFASDSAMQDAEKYVAVLQQSVAAWKENLALSTADTISKRVMAAEQEFKFAGLTTNEIEVQKALRDMGFAEAQAALAATTEGTAEYTAALNKVTQIEANIADMRKAQSLEAQFANAERLRTAKLELDTANMTAMQAEIHKAIIETGDGAHIAALREALQLEQQAAFTGRLRDMRLQAQTLAMTTEQAELYKFQLEGATPAMMRQLEAAQKLNKQLQANADIVQRQKDFQDEIAKRTMTSGEQAYYDAIRAGADETHAALAKTMDLQQKAFEIADKYDPGRQLAIRQRELDEMKSQGLIDSEAYRREMQDLRAEAAEKLEVNVSLTGVDTFTAGSKRFMKELQKMQMNTAVEKRIDADLAKASAAQAPTNLASMASAKKKFNEETSISGMSAKTSAAVDAQYAGIAAGNIPTGNMDSQLSGIVQMLSGMVANIGTFIKPPAATSQAEQQLQDKQLVSQMNKPQASTPPGTLEGDLFNRWFESDKRFQADLIRAITEQGSGDTSAAALG
jgi:hypothetical protein